MLKAAFHITAQQPDNDDCEFHIVDCAFHIDDCAFHIDDCAFNIDDCAFNIDDCEFNIDDCAFNIDDCEFNIDDMIFHIDDLIFHIAAVLAACRGRVRAGSSAICCFTVTYSAPRRVASPALVRARFAVFGFVELVLGSDCGLAQLHEGDAALAACGSFLRLRGERAEKGGNIARACSLNSKRRVSHFH